MEGTTSLVAALAKKSGEAAADIAKENAKGFLQKIIGPSAEAIGEAFAVRFRERMFNNLVEVVARAKKKLKEAGVEPREVPLKIVHRSLKHPHLKMNRISRNYGRTCSPTLLIQVARRACRPHSPSF
jgi:hypothetical protein